MSRDAKRLLGGWATDSLSPDERRELLQGALADQSLFDALVEEDGLRELLADPVARERIARRLQQPTWQDRLRGAFRRPATLADALVAAAVLVIAIAMRVSGVGAGPVPAAAGRPAPRLVSQAVLERLAVLPERSPAGASVALSAEGPLLPGRTVAVRAALPGAVRLLVLGVSPDGPVAQLWPERAAPPPLPAIAAPERLAARALLVRTPTRQGEHRLRLVAAPADLDLTQLTPAEVEAQLPRLTLLDLRYEVRVP
jgi:hypothetical protein